VESAGECGSGCKGGAPGACGTPPGCVPVGDGMEGDEPTGERDIGFESCGYKGFGVFGVCEGIGTPVRVVNKQEYLNELDGSIDPESVGNGDILLALKKRDIVLA
jgi:hypothetical protein